MVLLLSWLELEGLVSVLVIVLTHTRLMIYKEFISSTLNS